MRLPNDIVRFEDLIFGEFLKWMKRLYLLDLKEVRENSYKEKKTGFSFLGAFLGILFCFWEKPFVFGKMRSFFGI